jgi:hypothetical protein
LEEKQSEVSRHFKELGLKDDSPILLHCGGIGQGVNAIDEVESLIHQCGDVALVVIDPLFHLLKVRDTNDYAAVYPAMTTLMELARRTGVATLALHHLKKRESDDIMDGALGSTAITASVDTYLALKLRGELRSIISRQRYGCSLEESRLIWDPESRRMSLGQTSQQVQENQQAGTTIRIKTSILDFVTGHAGCTQEAIFAAVTGNMALKKNMLAALVHDEAISAQGSGRRGDPFTYWPDDHGPTTRTEENTSSSTRPTTFSGSHTPEVWQEGKDLAITPDGLPSE